VFLDQDLCHGADVLRLGAVKADALQVMFEPGGIDLRIIARGLVFLEHVRRDLVDLHVGALRREHGRDQQLERIGEVEFAVRIGISRGQRAADFGGALLQRRRRGHACIKRGAADVSSPGSRRPPGDGRMAHDVIVHEKFSPSISLNKDLTVQAHSFRSLVRRPEGEDQPPRPFLNFYIITT
jgi:hypothetical protein